MRNNHQDILRDQREKKVLSDELMERMNKVRRFKDEFGAAFSIQQTAKQQSESSGRTYADIKRRIGALKILNR